MSTQDKNGSLAEAAATAAIPASVAVEPSQTEARQARIAAARKALAERYAADPENVDRFNARMANLTTAKKRERERFERLVLDRRPPRPTLGVLTRPAGMSKEKWKVERKRREADHAAAVQAWEAEQNGRPLVSTVAYSRAHADAIIQLERNGTITAEQAERVAEISNVRRSIASGVDVKVASFEARVDNSGGSSNRAAEGIKRVRMHLAYSIWRRALPTPAQAVLDMIVGDAVGYSVVARRYRMHARKTKRLLIDAIDLWPLCVARAFEVVDRDVMYALGNGEPTALPDGWRDPQGARPVRQVPADVQGPARSASRSPAQSAINIDPSLLDERGYLRPWSEIANILRASLIDEAA